MRTRPEVGPEPRPASRDQRVLGGYVSTMGASVLWHIHLIRSVPVLYFSNIILDMLKISCFNFFFLIDLNSNNGDNSDYTFLLFYGRLRLCLKKMIIIFFISLRISIIY